MIQVQTYVKPLVETFGGVTKYYTDVLNELTHQEPLMTEIVTDRIIEQGYRYFDSQARSDQDSYKHMYEFGMSGQESGRLFALTKRMNRSVAHVGYGFLEAHVPSPESDQVFRHKAQALEEGWTFTISPVHSDVLVFEIDGETIFTPNSVVTQPGRDIQGNFTRLFVDYMHYVAPATASRVALEISQFHNVRQHTTDGRTAVQRDIRSADVSTTSH